MTKEQSNRITLDQPATYQIKVPGVIDLSHNDWAGNMSLTVDEKEHGFPITTLTGELDQAALHGVLRRLYGQGLPILSVQWIRSRPP